jgi:uncharacterized protein
VILIDSNVLMYAAGTPHRNKAASAALIERIAAGGVDAILDAEVLQEILHRYRAIGRWASGRELYDLARRIIPAVIPITVEILDVARSLLDAHSALMARDALHAAVCREADLDAICTYDRDFDRIPGIQRLEPSQVP